MVKLHVAGWIVWLSASAAVAAETIEAIGSERCGKPPRPYTVDFLAPEEADLEARVKVMVRGSEDVEHATPALSLDGTSCANGRCIFHATKGRSYKLVAKSTGPKPDELCISVVRP
jgi:hypothetical protein